MVKYEKNGQIVEVDENCESMLIREGFTKVEDKPAKTSK